MQVQRKDGELRKIREAKAREQRRREQLDDNVAAARQALEAAKKERDEYLHKFEHSFREMDKQYRSHVDKESELKMLQTRADRDQRAVSEAIDYLMKEVLTTEDERRMGRRAGPGAAETYAASHGLSIEVRNMGDLCCKRARVETLLQQNDDFQMAWVEWSDWVRQPWELYTEKYCEQAEVTEDEKAQLLQEEQDLRAQLQAQEDLVEELSIQIRAAMQRRDTAAIADTNGRRTEANKVANILRVSTPGYMYCFSVSLTRCLSVSVSPSLCLCLCVTFAFIGAVED